MICDPNVLNVKLILDRMWRMNMYGRLATAGPGGTILLSTCCTSPITIIPTAAASSTTIPSHVIGGLGTKHCTSSHYLHCSLLVSGTPSVA